ncbi:MAG: hypothetical protein DMG06_14795, partial [Acidobacteria bacterium]
LRLYVHTLARIRGRQRFGYLLERLKRIMQMVAQRDVFRGDRSEFYLRVVTQANLAALQQYQPRVYPGHVVLFRAEGRKVASGDDRRLAWNQLAAGGLEIQAVPGADSGLMLTEPHVRVLARRLEACIESARLATMVGRT